MRRKFGNFQKRIPYSTKLCQGKTLANQSFQSFGKENSGEFTIATISYYSECGICLDKILANDDRFAKVLCNTVSRKLLI